jgi:hypothetical protein
MGRDSLAGSYMTRETWSYPPELANVLLAFGLKPNAATPPSVVRAALNDLYRYEIRRLRTRLLDGRVEKARYVDEVITLRKRYWPLSLQLEHWERLSRSSRVPIEGPQSGSAG